MKKTKQNRPTSISAVTYYTKWRLLVGWCALLLTVDDTLVLSVCDLGIGFAITFSVYLFLL